jgi:nicotinamide-nucleotide amidase
MSALAAKLVQAASAKRVMIATAESCTGGLVSAAITGIAGSSTIFDRGFVTYSNEAKAELLGVSLSLLDQHGAVSPHVACAMAEGALKNSRASISVAITGIAGPGGGSVEKPVGLVHFATSVKDSFTIQF